ncbi:MAG: DUF2961 domain-containing protein [Chitinophagaceae bacterium]
MNRLITTILLLFLFSPAIYAQGTHIGLKDILHEMNDLSSLPAYKTGTYSAEVSTYDRTGLNDDGFNGTYSFVRRNADSTLVLFDVKGPGVINRIWTPTPSDDSLDFYIDDTTRAAFTICYRDLFSGKVYPFVAPLCANQLGGFYCYLPIPFNLSCKIVFKGKRTMFHQIGYRQYPAGTIIDKFQLPLQPQEQQALNKIKSAWSKEDITVTDMYKEGMKISTLTKSVKINPGQTVPVVEIKSGGRILGFDLTSSVNAEKVGKDIDLKITWDDEKMAAVYCPIADFFGYAFGKPSMKSVVIGSDKGRNYSYFPMPFDRSAKIELVYRDNAKSLPVTFQCTVYTNDKKREQDKEGKFYAYWKRNNPVPDGQPHEMLNIKGKGHFAGTVLQAQGLKPGMTIFFEGDDSTVVDGSLRMHGTGSEDFFNGGWYALMDTWDAAMSLPLSGSLEYSLPLCRTGGYRLFISDKVSFEKSFFHSIEHGPEHNLAPADYTSVSYYYCSQPNEQIVTPSNLNTKIYYPDTLTLYPQLLNMTVGDAITIDPKWTYPTGGMSFYFTVKNEGALRISLKDIPVGNYNIFLDYVTTPESASFSVWQRQTQLSQWIDGYSKETNRQEMKEIAPVSITSLNNTISFGFRTNGNKNKFILNRILLVKK